jgi:hypothetical protein
VISFRSRSPKDFFVSGKDVALRKALRVLAASAGALALVLSGTAVASAKGATGSRPSPRAYTCTGGDIPSGNYASITVTGACNVAADAALDAQSGTSTITVDRNVTAFTGSFLGLDCQPPAYTGNSAYACTVEPDAHSTITVNGNGNVTTLGAGTVLLNGAIVKGNVMLAGGGGGDLPWTIKNNTLSGNLTLIGQKRNLFCIGLAPGVSGGFAPGEVNVVGRSAIGQCATLV